MSWHGREGNLEGPRGPAARFDGERRCPTLVGMAIAVHPRGKDDSMGAGRLVVKDLMMLSGALVCVSRSAQELLRSMDPQLSERRGAGPDGAGPLARTGAAI